MIQTRGRGKLVAWNDEKGYGFIAPDNGKAQVFIHIKAFGDRSRRPVVNDAVTYSVTRDRRGRARAERATLAGHQIKSMSNSGAAAMLIASLFITGVGVLVFTISLSPLIPIAYVVMSLITFLTYGVDKSAARSGDWRKSEWTLHLLALAGGWPGALVAQQFLRHKSRKKSFRRDFWLTVLMNCAALVWFSTSFGPIA